MLRSVAKGTITPIHPYSFELSVHKPAGWSWLTPEEVFADGTMWSAAVVNDIALGLKARSAGTIERPKIDCEIFSDEDVGWEDMREELAALLGANEDVTDFYEVASSDPILKDLVGDLYGMRDTRGQLFPLLTLATTLQLAPMSRSLQMMGLLVKNYGTTISFDGKTIGTWPTTDSIAKASVEDLKSKCKMGYRAKNLKAIAETLEKGFPGIGELEKMPPDEARKKLLELRGVGKYSVGIVFPNIEFPVDSWSLKIFSFLFFGDLDTMENVRTEAERRWGKWKGLAFVYVLNDLENLSILFGKDLNSL